MCQREKDVCAAGLHIYIYPSVQLRKAGVYISTKGNAELTPRRGYMKLRVAFEKEPPLHTWAEMPVAQSALTSEPSDLRCRP